MCDYDHYFTIAFNQDTEDMTITLIPDATTTAPTSEIDFLQDADGDGVRDGGIHQMVPASGYYCTVSLWLNDTAKHLVTSTTVKLVTIPTIRGQTE